MLARITGYVFAGCVIVFVLALTFGPATLFEDLQETLVEEAKDVPGDEESSTPGEEITKEESNGALTSVLGVVTGLIVCLFGLLFLLAGVAGWSSRPRKAWPTVQGTVLTSRVDVVGFRSEWLNLGKPTPVVAYAFRAADGQQYEGEQNADKHSGSRAAQKWVQSYPAGTHILVSYHPSAPWLSTMPGARQLTGAPGRCY